MRFLYCLLFSGFILCSSVFAKGILNIYNWSNYMPPDVLEDFEKKTGIQVNYSVFDDNPELYTKLKLNPGVYDLIVPSSYFVARMRQEGLLQKLDKTKLPNVRYLNPLLMHFPYDPHTEYSLPYFWGTTGIALNDKYYDPKSITTWDDLWAPRFRGQLLLMNELREIFDIAFRSLGYSINDTNKEHLHEAYVKLLALMPNVKVFNESQESSIYADEDALAGAILSGDAYRAGLTNSHVKYIYPKGKTLVWIDNICIPIDAPHLENAYIFLNYILDPKISARIAEYSGYSSPNLGAIQLLPKSIQENPTLYPPDDIVKDAEVEADLPEEIKTLMQNYWELLKLSS